MKLNKELNPKEDGFAKEYQSKIYNFNKKKLDKYDLQELRNWHERFNKSFLDINEKYIAFCEEVLSDVQNVEYKMNFEVAGVYISQIQNRFLNPINNEINKKQAEESLKKANSSINLGIWSIIIGLVLGIGGFVWNYYNPTPCYCNSSAIPQQEIYTEVSNKAENKKLTLPLDTNVNDE